LRANGWAGQAQPNGGASRNRDTKNNFGLKEFPAEGGAEKRASKNSLPLNPVLFARPLFLGVRPRICGVINCF